MKEHRPGFPKIGRDSRIDLRGPSYGARKVVDFRHFQPKLGERITNEPCYIIINPRVAMFKKTYLFWFRNDLTSACVADRMITKKQLLL